MRKVLTDQSKLQEIFTLVEAAPRILTSSQPRAGSDLRRVGRGQRLVPWRCKGKHGEKVYQGTYPQRTLWCRRQILASKEMEQTRDRSVPIRHRNFTGRSIDFPGTTSAPAWIIPLGLPRLDYPGIRAKSPPIMPSLDYEVQGKGPVWAAGEASRWHNAC